MKNFTEIRFLLDRSGSMGSIKTDVIGGFNQFVKTQQEAGDNAALTLVQFDSQGVDETIWRAIRAVVPLTVQTYQPRAMTPLLDAFGDAIESLGRELSSLPESERPDKVVFVVLTDGIENASRRFSKEAIRSLTERQTKIYKWNFIYLGANQDSFAEAGGIGVNYGTVADYAPHSVRAAMGAVGQNLVFYRSSDEPTALNFTEEQRDKLREEPEEQVKPVTDEQREKKETK